MPLKCPGNWDVYLKEDTCLRSLNETEGKIIFNSVLLLLVIDALQHLALSAVTDLCILQTVFKIMK